MTTPAFALIGHSFPSDRFARLYEVSLELRAERRAAGRAAHMASIAAPSGRRWRLCDHHDLSFPNKKR